MKTVKSARKLHTVESAVSGMRRVDCVRMVEDLRPRFFVVGIGHRFPVEREISPAVARALLEEVAVSIRARPLGDPARGQGRGLIMGVGACRAVTDSHVL